MNYLPSVCRRGFPPTPLRRLYLCKVIALKPELQGVCPVSRNAEGGCLSFYIPGANRVAAFGSETIKRCFRIVRIGLERRLSQNTESHQHLVNGILQSFLPTLSYLSLIDL